MRDLLFRWAKRDVVLRVSLILGILVLLGGPLCYGVYLFTTLTLPQGEDQPPLIIYGSPFVLKPGLHIKEARLTERLDRLNYRQVLHEIQAPGEYRLTEDLLDLYLRDSSEGHFRAAPIRLVLENGKVIRVWSLSEQEEIFFVPLEPPLVSGVVGSSRQVRNWVPLAKIPPLMIQAVLAVEDRRFYSHVGVDPFAVARAVLANLREGTIVQGGSTITQQLAKNLYYSHQRTWFRKLKESVAALVLELMYDKDTILESYLNEIYLGQAGSVAIYGVGEASQRYFGKPIQGVTVEEAALLGGMIKGPNTYSPLINLHLAKQRRDLVLRRLTEEGNLTGPDLQEALNQPMRVVRSQDSLGDAPYFVDYLLRHSEESFGTALPAGSKVFTTLDPVLQRLAQELLQAGLSRLESTYPLLKRKDQPLQGALVALNPKTGGILAMVGGRDYRTSQFNRAVQARRQPGSLFKPFVYLAAFEAKDRVAGVPFTPATLVLDTPVSYQGGLAFWSPQNYDRQFRGEVTIRTALEQSLNVPAVRIAQAVGIPRITEIVRNLGLTNPENHDLSIALGTSEVSLLEITSAFGVLANSGLLVSPTALRTIVAANGETLWQGPSAMRQVVSPRSAYLLIRAENV